MKIAVHYLAQLKHAAGLPGEALDLHRTCSLEDLLRLVSERHGERVRRLLFPTDGRVNPALLLFVGDAQAHGDAVLQDGDVVTVLAPMAGG